MKSLLPLVVFVPLMIGALAGAAEPVTVLGLPLGGKVKMPIPKCPTNATDTEVRMLCWAGTPTVYKGARSGWARVPGEDQMPKWAANGIFEPWIKNDGTLHSFEVKSPNADQFVEILNSIGGRFGQSQRESRPGSAIMSAEWIRKDINIRLMCARGTGCVTTFTSSEAYAEHQRDLAARKAKDDARSATP